MAKPHRRYCGVNEADYEWLTDQIVQVANRCCAGRLVSVLEGGYNLQGGLTSAFARSVAAHVRALAEPCGQAWDPMEAAIEREAERKRREERAAKAAEAAARAAANAAAVHSALAAAAAELAADGGADEPLPAKRRRTAPVDYAALAVKLQEEEARGGGGGGAP